ncbi:hypothetical protein [Janthinobacterium sp.]|uniref:hypothetical protein n=1 Tax=Janthinobacterium sp. TaxID=1871054 RepID=UPI002636BC1F|nr:hypothetical protein [Janthinobacterium sp.]
MRLSSAPAAYTMWIFVLNGAGLVLWMLVRGPADLLAGARAQAPVAAIFLREKINLRRALAIAVIAAGAALMRAG